jgi:hypothetical protein
MSSDVRKSRRDETFQVGDFVLLSTAHLHMDNQTDRPSRKLQARFVGPFQVEAAISPVAYRLSLPATMKIHPVLHISQLKQHKTNPPEFSTRIQEPPPPVANNDHIEYEVEKILDKRIHHRRTEYQVARLSGLRKYLEPAANLPNAQDAIANFEQRCVADNALKRGRMV